MLELKTINVIIESLKWILTLGKSEIVDVKKETNEVIKEVSKSLINLWDVTKEITKRSEVDLTKEQFEERWDYFFKLYLGDENISAARTHCGNVMREIRRIEFNLANIFHTNIGKWSEAKEIFDSIAEKDPVILQDYNRCIASLENRMKEIREHFDTGNITSARQSYATLKRDLENDIKQLREGVATMEKAINHVNEITG